MIHALEVLHLRLELLTEKLKHRRPARERETNQTKDVRRQSQILKLTL